MRIKIELDIPDDALDENLQEDLTAACREEVVLRLFAERRISSALATRLLGLTRIQFMELTRQRRIPHDIYTAEDFREDMRDLEAFEHKASGRRNRSE